MLDRVLKQWVVDAPLPPRFQEQVWQRIAPSEVGSSRSFRSLLTRFMEVVLPQPKIAYSYVTALLVLGLAASAWAAEKQNSRLQTSLSSRYLQSVDPYQTASEAR